MYSGRCPWNKRPPKATSQGGARASRTTQAKAVVGLARWRVLGLCFIALKTPHKPPWRPVTVANSRLLYRSSVMRGEKDCGLTAADENLNPWEALPKWGFLIIFCFPWMAIWTCIFPINRIVCRSWNQFRVNPALTSFPRGLVNKRAPLRNLIIKRIPCRLTMKAAAKEICKNRN